MVHGAIAPAALAWRLEGAPNFRDLGGLKVGDACYVRPGRVFRSGMLSELTDADLRCLGRLAPRCVLDLRSQRERALYPSRWPPSWTPQVHAFDIDTDVRAGPGYLQQLLRAQPGVAGARAMMIGVYEALPQACVPVLRHIFAMLSQASGDMPLPLIMHCTAGKDRTGFVVAMLLYALGAAPQVVLDDYLQSASRCDLDHLALQVQEIFARMSGAALDRAALDAINSVQADYLDAALAVIASDWGGLSSYLEHACALDAHRRKALRAALLVADKEHMK